MGAREIEYTHTPIDQPTKENNAFAPTNHIHITTSTHSHVTALKAIALPSTMEW